jgi:hypothetical protein
MTKNLWSADEAAAVATAAHAAKRLGTVCIVLGIALPVALFPLDLFLHVIASHAELNAKLGEGLLALVLGFGLRGVGQTLASLADAGDVRAAAVTALHRLRRLFAAQAVLAVLGYLLMMYAVTGSS